MAIGILIGLIVGANVSLILYALLTASRRGEKY